MELFITLIILKLDKLVDYFVFNPLSDLILRTRSMYVDGVSILVSLQNRPIHQSLYLSPRLQAVIVHKTYLIYSAAA